MVCRPYRLLALLLIFSLVVVQLPRKAHAQVATPNAQQLDQLLAPVALYPDSLLAQITTASTNPQEILDVTNWLANNPGLSGDQLTNAAQQQGFDPAFIALVNFPDVLQMMAENIDDYAAIGQAVTANQAAVSDSIQRLRAQAYAAGALRSNQQQTVVVQPGPQTIYVIQPANPQVVYVPQYNPTVVYAAPSTGSIVTASLISFGVGIGIGALISSHQPWGWGGWGWNWGRRGIYYNHVVWGGWHGGYRPPNPWYRPRPIVWTGRPGYGGNWHYHPPNYRPPRPRPPVVIQPGPGNRPVYRPPANRPPAARPPANQRPPNNGYQPKPGARPQPQPQPSRPPQQKPPQYQKPPNNQRPPNNQKPPNNGHQPENPGARPQPQPSRPSQQQRPPEQQRPQQQRPPNQKPQQQQKPSQHQGPQKPRPGSPDGGPQPR